MPELPEVETVARSLEPQVKRHFIINAESLAPKTVEVGQQLWPLLPGAEIVRIRRRAKLLLIDLATTNGQRLILAFHLKMTGRLFVHPLGFHPHRHTKLVFTLGTSPGGPAESLLFFDDARTFGYCRLMRPEDLPVWPFWNKLGPEPLEHSPEELAEQLSGKKGCIKAALLDQTVIAGIGNIYADESLFRAGIRPEAHCSALSKTRLVRLTNAIQAILQQAIDECGSSIRDYRDAHGNAGAFQNNFNVYGRAGERCKICGALLKSCRVAGRGTVYCSRCQKK